ncbi:hypothetical protein [Subtercola sp. YIM 133946]|uniref:hypothetical protein n=1 Tax=Subtercola sp. YIM 133946 TaxID=3118909 RepID=UPI002F925EB0
MAWTYWICDAITGLKLAQVSPSGFRAQRRLGDQGQGTLEFTLTAFGPQLDWNDLTTPWARMIVPCWNNVPQYAGIMTDSDWDDDSGTYTIEHGDFWTLLDYRSTLGADGYSTVNYRDEIQNYTLATILRIVFRLTFEGPTAGYGMNVSYGRIIPDTVPPTGVGAPHDGTDKRQYNDYNLPKMLDTLHELMTAAGGPEVTFNPQWDAFGNLQLVLRMGTAATPKLTGPRIEWHLNVPQPKLTKVRRRIKGSGTATNVVATGAGSELDRKYAKASTTPVGLARERFTSYPQLTDQVALQAHADQDLAASKDPTVQYSASMTAGDSPGILDLVEGQPAGIYSSGSPVIPNGWNELRVVGWTIDMTDIIPLEFQPIGGA